MTVALTRPLTLPRFRALWIASVFSNLGGFFQSVAASWLMLELTGSPVWVSAMAASTMLPLLFLALPSGALADLANRRNILLVTQATMLASVLGMRYRKLPSGEFFHTSPIVALDAEGRPLARTGGLGGREGLMAVLR